MLSSGPINAEMMTSKHQTHEQNHKTPHVPSLTNNRLNDPGSEPGTPDHGPPARLLRRPVFIATDLTLPPHKLLV